MNSLRVSTPPGIAGIAVVEVPPSMRGALLAVLRRRSGAPFAPGDHRSMATATLVLGGKAVDEVLVVDRGALGIELHVHGAAAVLAALEEHFPCEPAGFGDVSARRLLHEALSVEQLDLALEQLEAPFAVFLAELDRLPVERRRIAVAAALQRSVAAMAMATPQRTVLIGAQNAGKSTLFNRLLFRERVLTGPMPGLTRDPIVEATSLAGYPYELVDTAGEGPAAAAVDAAAIAAGRSWRRGALVVLVVDGGLGPSALDRELLASADVVVATKTDLCGPGWPPDLPCHLRLSCTEQDAATVRRAFGDLLRAVRGLPSAGPVGGPAALTEAELRQLERRAVEGRG
jgi:small GTP-binding protein